MSGGGLQEHALELRGMCSPVLLPPRSHIGRCLKEPQTLTQAAQTAYVSIISTGNGVAPIDDTLDSARSSKRGRS